jgi:hypothetical protein
MKGKVEKPLFVVVLPLSWKIKWTTMLENRKMFRKTKLIGSLFGST